MMLGVMVSPHRIKRDYYVNVITSGWGAKCTPTACAAHSWSYYQVF
jgi:hypothetical protein